MTTVTLEAVSCYLCGSRASKEFVQAEDDLGGTPGRFQFVRCLDCNLAYQNPRVPLDRIGAYYDDTYIAHRKKRNWGLLTPLFERAMNRLDEDKAAIVGRYTDLMAGAEVLDVGCAVGTFLAHLRKQHGIQATGVDFKDLSSAETLRGVEFHCGLFYEADLRANRFDLVTMWHFLEHDYDPMRSLATAHRVMKPGGTLVIEVPRLDSRTFTWFGERWPGLQAPQHTVLYDRDALLRAVRRCGFEVIDYLPYGAFPAYFYLFTGAAFRLLKGRGLNLDKAIVPYFIGQLLALPLTVFERRLNLAMQTVICRRPLGADAEGAGDARAQGAAGTHGKGAGGAHAAVTVLRGLISGLLITAMSVVILAVAVLTLMRARRLYAALARLLARIVLRVYGVRVRLIASTPFPRSQTVYVSNHTSTIDLFVLVALGLPNCRFFLSGYLRTFVPLGIIAWAMGTFFTVPQDRPDERRRIFRRAADTLKRTGESVYLSPEGGRITTGEIGHFNKGAFHMATDLRVPIVPLYFHIPRTIDPGLGYSAGRGTVTVHVLAAIDTRGWTVEDVPINKDKVRDTFVRVHQELRTV